MASFLGATTVREYVIGFEDKPATPEQLEQMRELVRKEMEAGALGIGTSLIYPPAFYARTEELIELCKVAAKYQGKYISHMRSEGNQLFEALDELLRIAREANIPAEVYHIKAAGEKNWPKEDELLARIERAQKEGLKVTADMYTYTAAGTGLDACLPPWTEDGGYPALFKRLRDPATREKIKAEVKIDSDKWENLYLAAGSPEKILLVGFKSDKLKPLTGKTLADVAKMRGKDPIDTIMDLIAEDESRIGTVYYLMSEENVKKELRKPWISFGSDEASQSPEPPFTKSNPHPRAYGNFARVLGKYVRDEKVLPMSDAIHRLSGQPATNLGLDHRGFLKEGMFADVVVFDPATISDRATFEKPHQYAVGVKHVFVNGVQVIKDGEHTGAKPGRALWGPGKKKVTHASGPPRRAETHALPCAKRGTRTGRSRRILVCTFSWTVGDAVGVPREASYFPYRDLMVTLQLKTKARGWTFCKWIQSGTSNCAGFMVHCTMSATNCRVRRFPDLHTRGSRPSTLTAARHAFAFASIWRELIAPSSTSPLNRGGS